MRIDLYCFPSKLERQPSKCQNFEAQSHSLFSRCLRLATTITGSHPRLATGGWLDLTRQAFHLLDYSPLSGRTIPILLIQFIHQMKGGIRLMDKDSFIIGLLEDGFDAEDAEMIAQDLIDQFGDDPDFQD